MMKRYLTLSIILVLIFTFGLSISPSPRITDIALPVEKQYLEATIVWSDDFNDGNMDGWYTHEVSGQPANFSVIDGVVYSHHGDELLNVAIHENSVAYGTWIFDVYINRLAGIEFVETAEFGTNYTQDGYEIVFATEPFDGISPTSIQLHELYAISSTTWGYNRLDYYKMNPIGWHRIEITRDNTGYICVYLNSTPVLEAIDNTVTTTTGFAFAFVGAFDNVSVSDSVDIDRVAPYILQNPTDQVIAYGADFSYKLNATDFSGVVTWQLNDTTQFAISNEGLVTNETALEPGVYGLEVSVFDDDSYNRSVSFSVTVEEAVVLYDPTLIIVAGGGIAVVLIVVLVIFMKKRG
ncbi:MAG: hypothetical protein RTV31_16295 [Candidatus Thorarchaeota archaeon]